MGSNVRIRSSSVSVNNYTRLAVAGGEARGLLLLGLRHHERDVYAFLLVDLGNFYEPTIRANLLDERKACILQKLDVLVHVTIGNGLRAIVVARPGICLMRFVKTLKKCSSDGGVRNVSTRFSHIVRKDSSELSPEPQRMFSRFE